MFLSYRRTDALHAQTLKQALERRGLHVFLDVDSLEAGNYPDQLRNQIRCSDALILVATQNVFERGLRNEDWIRIEIETAKSFNLPIVPVPFDVDLTNVPLPAELGFLRELQVFPCDRLEHFDDSINRLLRGLGFFRTRRIRRIRRSLAVAGILGAVALAIALFDGPFSGPGQVDAGRGADGAGEQFDPVIPDLGKALRTVRSGDLDTIDVSGGSLQDESPPGFKGYYRLSVNGSGGVYAMAIATLRTTFEPELFLSTRISAESNIGTLELRGRGVSFLVLPDLSAFMIWSSEENQTPWLPLQSSTDRGMIVLGLHQSGRDAHAFVNSKYVGSLRLWERPLPGPVGITVKATPGGGIARFQRLAAWQL